MSKKPQELPEELKPIVATLWEKHFPDIDPNNTTPDGKPFLELLHNLAERNHQMLKQGTVQSLHDTFDARFEVEEALPAMNGYSGHLVSTNYKLSSFGVELEAAIQQHLGLEPEENRGRGR